MKALCLLALASCATSGVTKAGVAAGVLLACDYGQTAVAMQHGGVEHNVLLGPKPSLSALTAYFLAVGVAGYATTRMPEWARGSLYSMVIVGQSAMVLGNRYLTDNGTWCGL